jgi:hypothetical protein
MVVGREFDLSVAHQKRSRVADIEEEEVFWRYQNSRRGTRIFILISK